MQLLLGTSNAAKVARLRHFLRDLPLELLSGREMASGLGVRETGSSPEENARIKAAAYFEATSVPSLADDVALEIDGIQADDQPGVRVRRIGDSVNAASDSEMINHYSAVLKSLGGESRGVWTVGIALATKSGTRSQTLCSATTFVARASSTVVAGHPLMSLQIDPGSGRYLTEMTNEELDALQGERATGVASFVREWMEFAEP